MAKNKFLLKEPRCITDTRAYCYASPELFKSWASMSKAARKEFDKNGPIPCEGGGIPGQWCDMCRFGTVDEPEEYL